MNISIDYDKAKSSLDLKNTLKKLIVGSAIILNLSPLFLKNHININARVLLASSGFIFSLCCLKLPSTEYEQKLIKTYKDTALKQQKTVIQGEVLKHQTHLEIKNQQELATTIEGLPEYQIPYFATKYGVTPILASNYIAENKEFEPEETPVLNVPKSIFTNTIERLEKSDQISLEWLKKAINESCFIAGKKGSGKSHLMRWLLGGFIAQSKDQDIFFIIDKHYDPDSPWVVGIDENKLLETGRIVDGENAIPKIQELHHLLLNRIKNKLTFKKLGITTRIIIDEIDSYSQDEMEIISDFAKDIEYQGRKFGFSIILGAHSIKKGQMGVDSSVVGSMLNILFPSVVLDRHSILSGAFPSLPKIKSMINSYKSELPREGRIVIVNDDSEVFVSHIPRLDLVPVELNEGDNVGDIENNPATGQNPIERIKEWCGLCFESYKQYPDRSQIKKAWLDLTGNDLSDIALDLLIEKLGIG
jgi:energy-coupling factor transporter ATP-binding protein EcfA2